MKCFLIFGVKYKLTYHTDIMITFTLVQLMDTLGNVNHDISILGYWIFDYNHEKLLHLTRESLDIIFSPTVGEEKVVEF